MTRKIRICQQPSETTLPAPGLPLPGSEMTVPAPGLTVTTPGQILPDSEMIWSTPGPALSDNWTDREFLQKCIFINKKLKLRITKGRNNRPMTEQPSETTLPAPVLTFPASEPPIIPAPEMTLFTSGPILPAPEMALPAPGPSTKPPSPPLSITGLPPSHQPIPQPSLTVTGNKTQESVIINPTQPLANEKRKKQRFFWKVCPNCHRSFENLEKHLLSKRGACGKKPNGDLCTKAEAKEIHEKAKDELEERARDKSYFSTSELKAALLKSKTLHAFSRALTEMTGVYFDNRDVRDCAIQINEAEPAVPTVSVRHETPVAPPSDPAPSFSSMPERDCFSSEPLMGPSRPRKRVRWADNESNPEDSDVEGGVYDSFNIEDYRRLKDGVKNFMVPVLGRLSRNQLLDGDIQNLTAYLCFQVSFMFGHGPGVPEAMTIEEFLNRQLVEEEAMYVIPVENHKNASLKSAGIAISFEEKKIFLKYLKFARPALLKTGEPVPNNLLLSKKGRKLKNVSRIMTRFLRKIFPNGMRRGVRVPNQTTVRHFITTIIRRATNKTEEERQMMDEYVCDSGKFRAFYIIFII